MNDNFDKNIKQAIDILSKPENLKNILSILGNQNNPSTDNDNIQHNVQNDSSLNDSHNHDTKRSDSDGNIENITKMQRLISHLNSNDDPRIHLLNAITPFLSTKRQKIITNCIQALKISKLTNVLNNNTENKV